MAKEKIKITSKKFFNYWGPPVIWMGIIFAFSSYPIDQASEIYWQDFIVKKSAHLVEFGLLSILLYRGLSNSGVGKKRSGIFAIVLSIIYGVLDEFHQSFTPGREPTVRDVIFDTIGASLAIYYIWNYLQKAPRKLKALAKRWQVS